LIESLRIHNLAVVADAELEFGPGLNVVTGETGAGKSLVLGALELLAGQRAAAERVRQGADEAVVEAVFDVSRLAGLRESLAARGFPEDDALVVRRSVSAAGRSRVQLAGQLAPVSALAELLGERIEIASQHESQGLRRPEVHGRLLDAFGGLLSRREAVEREHAALREVAEAIARLRGEAEERARRRDYLDFQVREIDEAQLHPGEIEELAAERSRLLHAERLRGDAGAAATALGGDPALSDAPGAADLVAEAARRIGELAEIDAGLRELAARLAGAHADVSDAAAELERYAEGVEGDPARLAEVEERLAKLERLARKYGASADEILGFRDRAAAERDEIEGADARLAELEAERDSLASSLAKRAKALGSARRRVARDLSSAASDALRELALPHGELAVELSPAAAPEGFPCGPTGAEAPHFLFRANPGEEPRPIRKVASGGELSRLFLALRNVLRRADSGMVLVFDEVDAGVGGRVAERVGRALAELAGEHQVLCITHLPQIAARAEVHFRVSKTESGGRAHTRVARLDREARIEEIARMAGGERVTAATRRHARELLDAHPGA
jgi:DNA repair protein RecN (Recombination protein N)